MRKLTKVDKDNYELRYANKVASRINLVKPQNLFVVGGRGFSKTTEIQADRFIDVTQDMPRASMAILCDTYVNGMSNIVPVLLMGLERKGWKEGFHYVLGEPPPSSWEKPYLKTFRYKHTISLRNGVKVFIVSGDRPSSAAGLSLTHFFIDESKYVKEETLNRILPTLRDNPLLYNQSPYFQGITATTDMPNINNSREYDWILRMEENMDKGQINLILDAALVLNEIILELVKQGYNDREIRKDKNFIRWDRELRQLRMDSTMFVKASSYANADILGAKYYQNLFDTLEFSDFIVSVLNIEQKDADIKFFGHFSDEIHCYADGYNYRYYDQFKLGESIAHNSSGLKHLKPSDKLYGGMDFGNMCSLIIATEKGRACRALKNFHTLTLVEDNEYIPDIAKQFVDFFKPHQRKELYLHYDRAGNNYGKHGQAALFKREVEKHDGWTVHLCSVGKATVYHSDMYDLFSILLEEKDKDLPLLRIDENTCDELVCSIKMAPLARDRRGNIIMDKSSEKTRDLKKLPKYSTNMATAYIYLIEGLYGKYLPKLRVKDYSVGVY